MSSKYHTPTDFPRGRYESSTLTLSILYGLGVSYVTIEHYLAFKKAAHAGKLELCQKVLATREPALARTLVRCIQPSATWDEIEVSVAPPVLHRQCLTGDEARSPAEIRAAFICAHSSLLDARRCAREHVPGRKCVGRAEDERARHRAHRRLQVAGRESPRRATRRASSSISSREAERGKRPRRDRLSNTFFSQSFDGPALSTI